MANPVNHKCCIADRPAGSVDEADFAWREEPVPTPGPGQLLVRNIYLSLDPTNRVWMNEAGSYLPPIPIGEVMRGIAIGVVEESNHSGFSKGDIVQGLLGWQEYYISDGSDLNRLPKGLPIPLTAHFGLLGHIGLTAYFGLLEIGHPKPGE